MASGVNVVEKGEQRDGQEVYTISINRGTNTRMLDLTRNEVVLLLSREQLRQRRIRLQREEAMMDGNTGTTQYNQFLASRRLAADFEAALNYMGD